MKNVRVSDFNVRWSVDVDYDTERDCENNGCDGICRCSTITNTKIDDIDVSWTDFKLVDEKGKKVPIKKGPSDIEKYCLNRLIVIHGGFDEDNYEIIIDRGYYGEEIGGITFEDSNSLIDDANELLELDTDLDKVLFVLLKEYSYIPTLIESVTDAEVIALPLSEVQPSHGSGMMKAQDNYIYRVENEDEFMGIIFDSHLLIDGNHRFSYLNTKFKSNKKFKFINLIK